MLSRSNTLGGLFGKKFLYSDKHGKNIDPTEKNPLINLNTSVSLKFFIKNIDRYIIEESIKSKNIFTSGTIVTSTEARDLAWVSNKFITQAGTNQSFDEDMYQVAITNALSKENANYWVRWGWFEDNILSKFLSVTSKPKATSGDASYNPVIT